MASRTAGRWGPALAGLLFLSAACGGATSTPIAVGDDIVVGAAISQSGSLSQEGRLTQQGYEMWASWVNAQGGVVVGGVRHRVQLVIQDDQSRPALAASLAAGLVKDAGAQFLLGPYGS